MGADGAEHSGEHQVNMRNKTHPFWRAGSPISERELDYLDGLIEYDRQTYRIIDRFLWLCRLRIWGLTYAQIGYEVERTPGRVRTWFEHGLRSAERLLVQTKHRPDLELIRSAVIWMGTKFTLSEYDRLQANMEAALGRMKC